MEITALTAFLAPFLAPLLEGTQKAAAEAIGKFGEAAWGQAVKLWRRLAGKVEEHPAAREAAQDVAATPQSAGAQGALAWQLEKLLGADPALRDELARLWQEGVAAGITVTTVTASGERSVGVGGNVQGSTIVTGEQQAPPATYPTPSRPDES